MPMRQRTFAGFKVRWSSPTSGYVKFLPERRRIVETWEKNSVFEALTQMLLEIGGEWVVPPRQAPSKRKFDVEEMARVMARGQFYPGKPSWLLEGSPSQCHANIARLYDAGTPIWVVTGYALSKDGLWREHTWGVAKGKIERGIIDVVNEGDVIETTETRVCYFGYVLSDDEADLFAEANS